MLSSNVPGTVRSYRNLLDLVRAVLAQCGERNLAVEAVDCSARGPASALVEDRRFPQQVMTAAGVAPPELGALSAWQVTSHAGEGGAGERPGASAGRTAGGTRE